MLKEKFTPKQKDNPTDLKLDNGSRIAVIGGGPAGSFFSYFLLGLAERVGINVHVDIYEPQDFSRPGPAGCNHCGGIVSESLVQILSAEGINLPPTVIKRGIESYLLHMDVGSVRIDTPLQEKRIAAVFRGVGPLGTKDLKRSSFDGYLQELTMSKGAHLVRDRVESVYWDARRPLVMTKGGLSQTYDLIVGAVGVNAAALKLFKGPEFGYRPPQATKAFICELLLGHEMVRKYFGNSMHVFLINIPRLEFAALIPKDNYVTLCLLGEGIDKELVESFMNSKDIKGAIRPFADRVVLIGDCAVTRLYKDGIGAAYTAAKAAATTAIFHGISAKDFKRHYWPVCKTISTDNKMGKLIFAFTRQIQKRRFAKHVILSVVSKEQQKDSDLQHMSTVLWDTFTGSAPYRDIFLRTLNPLLIGQLVRETVVEILPLKRGRKIKEGVMETSALGRVYQEGEAIISQGEVGENMYVIQKGEVEVLQVKGEKEIRLAVLGEGDFFGEMALFERVVRSTTVRAIGEVHVLTVDKRTLRTLLRKIQEDPSLAFHILQKMSSRIRGLDAEHTRMKARATRMSPRVPANIPVVYNFIDRNDTGHILNISETGVFIYSSNSLKPGDTPHLKFSLPGEDKFIDVECEVVWVNKLKKEATVFNSMGIQFSRISPEYKGLISSFVKEMNSNIFNFKSRRRDGKDSSLAE
jgi:CRP-like cAMP-binding protein/flavin-dependent dehydrogenase